jgi:dTDP-4-amino-4,6-dideoxygalactose transaminase
VPSAVRKSGLEIIPCDLRPDTLDFNYSRLENLVDDETLCILSAHLFGIPADMDRIRRIARERNIFLVEDAAQAMGVVYRGRKLGSIGDVGFFSLGRGKHITCGSGGIIITSSEEIAAAITDPFDRLERESLQESAETLLKLFMMKIFMNSYLYWFPDGLPFLKIGETRFYEDFPVKKMNHAKSGAMHYWKEKLECMNNIRKKVSDEYKNRLGIKRDIGIYSFDIPYLRFPVYMRDEEHKIRLCREYKHYGVSPMYPGSVDSIAEIKESVAGYAAPLSARIAKTMVTLPTHNLVDETSRDRICDAIIGAMRPDFRNG